MAIQQTERTVRPVLQGLPGDELYTITDALDGDSYLALMQERRMAFWNSKPDSEKSHYQGYSRISRETLVNSLKRQTHAELSAVHAPNLNFQICPWQDVKVGMRVQAVFDAVTPEVTLPKFRPI